MRRKKKLILEAGSSVTSVPAAFPWPRTPWGPEDEAPAGVTCPAPAPARPALPPGPQWSSSQRPQSRATLIEDPSHARPINQVTGTPESNSFRPETIIKKLIKEPQLRYLRGTREDAMEGLHVPPLGNSLRHTSTNMSHVHTLCAPLHT